MQAVFPLVLWAGFGYNDKRSWHLYSCEIFGTLDADESRLVQDSANHPPADPAAKRGRSRRAVLYAGIFLLAFLAYATVLLPAPGIAIIFMMVGTFNPW